MGLWVEIILLMLHIVQLQSIVIVQQMDSFVSSSTLLSNKDCHKNFIMDLVYSVNLLLF
jgi:hypothetical protein